MEQGEERRVLLFDRHPDGTDLLSELRREGFAVEMTQSREDAVAAVDGGQGLEAVILGDHGSGDRPELVRAMHRASPRVPIVVLGSDGDTREVVGAMRAGAVDYVERGRASARLAEILAEILDDGATGNGVPARDGEGASEEAEHPFVIGSAAMRRVRELVEQVASTDVTVLVTGESGTGKEVVCRALHRLSPRGNARFVKVNCAALPDQLLESELFGYDPGAFTGADRRKPGKFELADGGTIFLDEIGEIEPGLQAKLLQVLQDNAFSRLGGDREVQVDARIIASTNRDLEDAVSDGSFRSDLYFRLNVVRIEVPPLRKRREEIPLLVEHFLQRYREEYGRGVDSVPDAAIDRLRRYDWPGNVRELENVVKRMVVLDDVDGVVDDLDREQADRVVKGIDVENLIEEEGRIPPLKEVSRLAALEVEGQLIQRALERTDWNRREASELLNISYKALLYKIRDCGLTPPD